MHKMAHIRTKGPFKFYMQCLACLSSLQGLSKFSLKVIQMNQAGREPNVERWLESAREITAFLPWTQADQRRLGQHI